MQEVKEQRDILKDHKILVLKDNHYLKYQENKDRLKDRIENPKQCLKEADKNKANNNQILLTLLNTKKSQNLT